MSTTINQDVIKAREVVAGYKELKNNNNMTIFDKIRQWGEDRNFYGKGGATIQSRFIKLGEEMG